MVSKALIRTISNDGTKELKDIVKSYKKDNEKLSEHCTEDQRKQLRDKFNSLFNSCLNYYLDKIQTEYDAEIEKINEQKMDMISKKNSSMEEFLKKVAELKID